MDFENTFSGTAVLREDDNSSRVVDMVSLLDGKREEISGPKLKKLTPGETAYADWLRDKTPENMSRVLDAFANTINSELTRYSGPKTLMRSRAKVLTVNAIKTFNPMSGARLNSWVVTNLKPLSRYGIRQRDVHVSEDKVRLAAQVNTVTNQLRDDLGRDPTDEELADETGMSVKRIQEARKAAMTSVTSGSFDEVGGDDDASSTPGVVEPSKVPFAQEAVYHDLSPQDRFIFDSVLGLHGSKKLSGIEIASRLGITPAAVSQRAKKMAEQIAYVVNNG